MKNKHFPFETYIHSTDIKEYNKDVRRKNYVIKYITLLNIDCVDAVSLNRLVQNLLFFRNTFSKEEFLKFFNEHFSNDEKETLAVVVYDMFVKSNKGEIGEHKCFYSEAYKLYKYVDYEHIINDIWIDLKNNKQVDIV